MRINECLREPMDRNVTGLQEKTKISTQISSKIPLFSSAVQVLLLLLSIS